MSNKVSLVDRGALNQAAFVFLTNPRLFVGVCPAGACSPLCFGPSYPVGAGWVSSSCGCILVSQLRAAIPTAALSLLPPPPALSRQSVVPRGTHSLTLRVGSCPVPPVTRCQARDEALGTTITSRPRRVSPPLPAWVALTQTVPHKHLSPRQYARLTASR